MTGYVNRTAKGWGYYQSSGKPLTNGPGKENFEVTRSRNLVFE